ncbi:gas vesicle protein GvpG [Streptomyces sp. NPDC002055]|uniref:gas vesicle protein GvpG n=1 Tax=Streptomyces sp. NPDC002055 TaxID=3154534 RepID=UPI00331E00F7
MGLLGEILLLPAAPVRGAGWVLRQVVAEAERQYYDPAAVQRELSSLAEQLDQGLIDEAEFDRREDELLDRLEVAQQRRAAAPGSGFAPPSNEGRTS